MQRKALLLSLGMHILIICLMFVDFHFAKEYTKAPPAILMVDLTKVKIADKTNLPQKNITKKEEKKKTEQKPTPKVDKPKQEVKTPVSKPEPKPAPVPKDAAAVQPPKEEKKKRGEKPRKLTAAESEKLIATLTHEMRVAASKLEFEQAAYLRDQIKKIREGKSLD